MLQGQGHRLGAAGDTQLGKDAADVELDRRAADHQSLGESRIAQSLDHQGQHFPLAGCQVKARLRRLCDLLDQRLGCLRGQGGTPGMGRPDRSSQLVSWGRLGARRGSTGRGIRDRRGRRGPGDHRPAPAGRPGDRRYVRSKGSPGDAAQNALAQALDPDHRAVAIHVDQASGLAGLLCPGDTVSAIVLNQFNSQAELESPTRWGDAHSPNEFGTPTRFVQLGQVVR